MTDHDIRVMHVTGLHLDGQLTDLLKLGFDHRFPVQDATLHSLERLAFECIEQSVTALIITGPVFSSDGPTLRACLRWKMVCKELIDLGIAVVVAGPDAAELSSGEYVEFCPQGLNFITSPQASPVVVTASDGTEITIGYRLTDSSAQHPFMIELVEEAAHVRAETSRTFSESSTYTAAVIPATAHTFNSAYTPLQPLRIPAGDIEHNIQGGANLVTRTSTGYIKQQWCTLAVMHLYQFSMEVNPRDNWEQLVRQMEIQMRDCDCTGAEIAIARWKVMGSGELLDYLENEQAELKLINHLEEKSPPYPRWVHEVQLLNIQDSKRYPPDDLRGQFQSNVLKQLASRNDSEDPAPELWNENSISPRLAEFCEQLAKEAMLNLDHDQIIAQALAHGKEWLTLEDAK